MKASCEAMAIDGSDYSISDLHIQHFIYLYWIAVIRNTQRNKKNSWNAWQQTKCEPRLLRTLASCVCVLFVLCVFEMSNQSSWLLIFVIPYQWFIANNAHLYILGWWGSHTQTGFASSQYIHCAFACKVFSRQRRHSLTRRTTDGQRSKNKKKTRHPIIRVNAIEEKKKKKNNKQQ